MQADRHPDVSAEIALFARNTRGKHLFAVLQRATASSNLDLGVVFCHSIADERTCGHRVLTEFARYLAPRGICSIRFDYTGFGDSEGETVDLTVSSQISDVKDAATRLIEEFNVSRVVLIGSRFGATVARLAANFDERVSALVLIAPVVFGADLWAGMLRSEQMSCLARGARVPKLEELRRAVLDGSVEIRARQFGRQFATELESVDLLAPGGEFKGPQLIVSVNGRRKQSRDPLESLVEASQRLGSEVTFWPDDGVAFWSEKPLYDGYVPRALYARTAEWLRDSVP